MEGTKGFTEIWNEAHRERSDYLWTMISRLLAAPRLTARKVDTQVGLVPAVQR